MTVHVYVYENTETTLWFESLVVCEGGPWRLLREYDKEIPDPVGPGGTSDYNQLENRPQINDVTLSGNKTSQDLKIEGSGSLADLFDYDAPALIDMNGAHDIAKFMAEYLNLSGMATGIGTSKLGYKVPTVMTGAYTWIDGADEQTATADVTITFADNSTLVKTLNFRTVKNRWVNAARAVDGAYIDTGLTLDFAYELFYEGYQPAGVSGTPIGAYASNAIRTTLRLMGNANKIQTMWPGNVEFTSEATGINFNEMHSATVNASGVELTQGSVTYNGAISGTASGTDGAPILVFNEAAGATYKNAVVSKAGVRSGTDTLIEIVMAEIVGEIVGVDIANLTQAEQDEILSEAYASVNADRIHKAVGTLEEVAA